MHKGATHTFLTSWAKSPHSLGGSPRSGLVQESSAELWLTMRVMPTVDKTAQVRAGPESTVQHTGFPQCLLGPATTPCEVVEWEAIHP